MKYTVLQKGADFMSFSLRLTAEEKALAESYAKLHSMSLGEAFKKALFERIEDVPKQAFTQGIKNIMNAKKIMMIVSGKNKAKAVYEMLYGPVTEDMPASILQLHPDCTLIVDEEAASLI